MESSIGHITADGHVFVYGHSKNIPHHVVFVIDKFGSMSNHSDSCLVTVTGSLLFVSVGFIRSFHFFVGQLNPNSLITIPGQTNEEHDRPMKH